MILQKQSRWGLKGEFKLSNVGDMGIIVKEIKKKFSDNIATSILALMGVATAQSKVGILLAKSALSIPDWLFYNKLNQFLQGLELSNGDRAKMRAFLASEGCATDNCIHIMNCINAAESSNKIELMCNAMRCALNGEIDLQLYFRVVHAVNMLMEDDMEFLAEHISLLEEPKENHLSSNNHTQALFTVGAMSIINTVWNGGEYAFTSFGKILDVSAVSFADVAKYPRRKDVIDFCLKDG